MGVDTGVLLTMALTVTVGAGGDNATEPKEVLLCWFGLDAQGPAVTELIKGDTIAAAILPIEAAGDGAGLGTGVTGDRATPCVPAEVAAGSIEDGEGKDGDAAGEAEVIGDGRGDAAMLEGVLDTDAVAGDWGDIGGKVGDEAGLSVVVALRDAVTGVGVAVTGVGDAVTGVGDAVTAVGDAVARVGDDPKELGVVAIEPGAAVLGDALMGLADVGTAAGNDGMELEDGTGVEPGEVGVVVGEDGVDAVTGEGGIGVDSGGEGRVDVGGD